MLYKLFHNNIDLIEKEINDWIFFERQNGSNIKIHSSNQCVDRKEQLYLYISIFYSFY